MTDDVDVWFFTEACLFYFFIICQDVKTGFQAERDKENQHTLYGVWEYAAMFNAWYSLLPSGALFP